MPVLFRNEFFIYCNGHIGHQNWESWLNKVLGMDHAGYSHWVPSLMLLLSFALYDFMLCVLALITALMSMRNRNWLVIIGMPASYVLLDYMHV